MPSPMPLAQGSRGGPSRLQHVQPAARDALPTVSIALHDGQSAQVGRHTSLADSGCDICTSCSTGEEVLIDKASRMRMRLFGARNQ